MNVIQRLADFLTISPTWQGGAIEEESRKATEKALGEVLKGGVGGGVPEPIVVGEVGGMGGGWGAGGGVPASLAHLQPGMMGGGGNRGGFIGGPPPINSNMPPVEGGWEGGAGGGFDHENIVYDFDPSGTDYGQPPQYDNNMDPSFDPQMYGEGSGVVLDQFDPEKILEEYGE